MKPMKTIKFIKDAAGYKQYTKHTLDEITARVLVHRGYAEYVKDDAPPPAAADPAAAPAAPKPRAAAPKKPAAEKKITKAPANRAMTAKKESGTTRRAPKKNEYETKGLHAKEADE